MVQVTLGCLLWSILSTCYVAQGAKDEATFLRNLNRQTEEVEQKRVAAEWNYQVTVTDVNFKAESDAEAALAAFMREHWPSIKAYNWATSPDPLIKKQFEGFINIGMYALSDQDKATYDKLISDMENIYNEAKACQKENPAKCDLSLPALIEIMATSRDEPLLKHIWLEFRKHTGKPIRDLYTKYIPWVNAASTTNGFADTVDFKLHSERFINWGETNKAFTDEIGQVWDKVKPFYVELFSYVRRKLRDKYTDKVVSPKGPIPAHLFGDMWAQSWENIFDLTMPFDKDAKPVDITGKLAEKKLTPLQMAQESEKFYISLGLPPMNEEFWQNSIFEKPVDRDNIFCGASVFDMGNQKDYRMKFCAQTNTADFVTIHEKMGIVEYAMNYSQLPFISRKPANEGIPKAVGSAATLSIFTPQHLNGIGLLEKPDVSHEAELNTQFKYALQVVPLLPFAYVLDLWRWDIFRGVIIDQNYNCEFWKRIVDLQGVMPPAERSEEDFDPGAKIHIVKDVMYISNFVDIIARFQIHEAMCVAAKKYDPKKPDDPPLHRCDITGVPEAGALLKKLMEQGSSTPWPDAMKAITGQPNLDPQPMLNYFKPILDWLKDENKKSGEFVGWEVPKDGAGICKSGTSATGAALSTPATGPTQASAAPPGS